ncbi:TetR/AcrR family transcriptional regulator [Longispora albida]|uniref:TetR/AcrR family transcriptional regulator n=1 Tax=Longispora albida TaxID=203523 RepID=UPI0003726D8A|nr:TetR/AcrR family transcriptional regulator [Longispora albida]
MSGKEQFASVWTRPERRRREQPALSRDQIVTEAIALLDTQGIDALSMRNLGARLGVGATSLYTHVANKDELMELVVDRVYGEIADPDTGQPGEWRAPARKLAGEMRAAILRHPWMSSVFGTGMVQLGPNVLRLSDAVIGLYADAGMSPAAANIAVNTITGYVMGVTSIEAGWLLAIARAGDNEQEWVNRLAEAAVEATAPYPRLRALYTEYADGDAPSSREQAFWDGLDCILDGIAVRLLGK